MGTRSRLIIRRRNRSHIYLWMHWDGYFSGQGTTLCKQMQQLLANYSREELNELVDALQLEDTEYYQSFSGEHLSAFLEGTKVFANDTCDDVEYEYILDCAKGYLSGISLNNDIIFTLTFPQLQNGLTFGELQSHLEEDD